MATLKSISSHIDAIRELVRETSDDSVYSNEYLYKLLIDSRATILSQEITKYKYISHDNYQRFCMPMDNARNSDCVNCLPVEISCAGIEKVWRSRYTIPLVITGRDKPMFKVYNVDFSLSISSSSPMKRNLQKYSKLNPNQITYEMVNNRLYLFNDDWLVVQLWGIFHDPSELSDIKVCNTEGVEGGENCFNPDTDHFPLDPTLNDRVYQLVLEKLGFSKSIPEDITNDSKSSLNNDA